MLHAQKLHFERYTVENGLQNNIVFGLAEDAKGLMWFATGTGIDRFDGTKFVHYTLPQKNNTRTEYLQVQHILADGKKQIWAAAASNLFFYNVKKDLFEFPNSSQNLPEKNKGITSLSTTYDGQNLIIGQNSGFYLYKPSSNEMLYPDEFNQHVRSTYQDHKGVIWVGGSKGIRRFILNGKKISELTDPMEALSPMSQYTVIGISQDAEGKYWLITGDKGIFIYDANTLTLQRPSFFNTFAKVYTVKDVHHDKQTKLHYITMDGGGLIVMNNELSVIETYQMNEDDPTTLSSNAVYDVFNDSYNRIWVTTYGGGVNVRMLAAQPFINFTHQINNTNSLSNNAAKATTEDRFGNLWLGSRKGISKYHPNSKTWQHFNEEIRPPGFTSDNILCLYNDSINIWAATYGGGLMKINATTHTITNYMSKASDSNTIGTDYVYAVLGDAAGRIWSGGIRGPVSYLDIHSGRFNKLQTPFSALNCIIENSNHQILFGTEKGVYVEANGSLQNFFQGKVTERILYIMQFDKDSYWLGTLGNGIIIISSKNGVQKRITTADGLPSEVICGMTRDKNGDVWIGTSKGIAHYQISTHTITAYSKADGLAGSQVNYGAVFRTRNNEIIFGTTDGFSMFNPESIKTKGHKPIIVFTGLKVNNKQVFPDDENNILTKQIDEVDKLVLHYNQNSFTIDFVNTSPTISGKHLYIWKLEGFDKDWSQPSTLPTATYTNLGSGKYTLHVKAFAKGQLEDAQIRSITIIIKAPWWLTGWAFAGYLLLLAAGAMAAFNYYNIRISRKKYADRLHLNTSISHEIRTPLTLIKGPVNALSKVPNLSESEKTNLELAKKNIEKLESIISQFIDYQKTGMRKMQMQVVKMDLVALVNEITASFIPLMKEKNIHFTYTKPSDSINILFDKDKMEKVFNNLLSNAVKYTPVNKDISVEVSKDHKEVIISVRDTGIGIPTEQQRFIFNGYYRADNTINLKETGSGIGLNVAKELVEMHKGKLEFKSHTGTGSEFTVRLPIINEALLPFLVKDNFTETKLDIPNIAVTETHKTLGKRILIAEDNDELRGYLKKELEQVGYKVTDAVNGSLALAALQKIKPDLIITDVMMPEMNGFQLCMAVKNEITTCHIPVIMLTAIHDKDYLIEGYRSGADDYVKKPFDLNYIITRIENLLQNHTRFRNKIMSVFEQEESVIVNDADLSWLKKATETILEHISSVDFSVEKLSSLMNMSRPVLFRKFKTISGESPQQYIQQIRLRKAIELLQLRKLNITEISLECGFGDAKYFSTVFKKHFGKSPTEYLQENIK